MECYTDTEVDATHHILIESTKVVAGLDHQSDQQEDLDHTGWHTFCSAPC